MIGHNATNPKVKAKRSNTRIRIIEDSHAIQTLTKLILTFQGEYDISYAEYGKVGLEIIEKNPPFDLILLDMERPIMNGEECIKNIRSLSNHVKPKTAAIACTENIKQYSPEEFQAMGCNDCFIKGQPYVKLMEKIQPILDKAETKD